jgi:hypothetical protein
MEITRSMKELIGRVYCACEYRLRVDGTAERMLADHLSDVDVLPYAELRGSASCGRLTTTTFGGLIQRGKTHIGGDGN